MNAKKTLALLLALLMLAAAILPGCKEPGTPGDTTAAETEAPDVTTEAAPAADLFKLVEAGKSEISIVRPDTHTNSDADVKAAMSIRSNLVKLATVKNPVITTDWTKDGKHDSSTVEILVGDVNYDETAAVKKDLGYGDYCVKVVGNKIIVLGFTDNSMNYAATVFNTMVNQAAVKVEGDDSNLYNVFLKAEDLNKSGTRNQVISKIPVYDGGSFGAYYLAGDETDEVIIKNTTAEEFRKYQEKLKAGGYTEYTTNEITGNYFGTYYNSEFTINAGFYAYESSVRILVEPFESSSLIGLESDNKYNVVTTSQISMIGLEYKKSDGGYASNGLSILMRLADGRFIVVDGGFNRAKDMTMLINRMKEQSAGYADKTGGIKVAAWIITHAHGDHQGAITGQNSALRSNKITVERMLVNFMSNSEREKSINYYLSNNSSNWSNGEGGGYTSVYTTAATLGAEVVNVHVGQVFYLADLKLEVLYTIESYGPAITNALNTTSLVMKLTFTDPATKKETVYMSTGDATGPGFLICHKMYGSYLKSDIVQVAHHGYTTWGTENGTTSAYIDMAPPTLAWPQGEMAYPNYVNKSYNAVLWNKSSNPNYIETLVAGWEDSITIFPMPYTPGSAKVTLTHGS